MLKYTLLTHKSQKHLNTQRHYLYHFNHHFFSSIVTIPGNINASIIVIIIELFLLLVFPIVFTERKKNKDISYSNVEDGNKVMAETMSIR